MSMFSITSCSVAPRRARRAPRTGRGSRTRGRRTRPRARSAAAMCSGVVAQREQAGVELRVQRLDAPVHDLREAREVLDRADLEPGLAQRRARCRRWRRARRRARPARARSRRCPSCRRPTAARAAIRTSPGCIMRLHRSRTIPQPTRTYRRPARGAGGRDRARTAPRAIRRTASGSSSCSIGRSASRTSSASVGVRQLDRALEDDRPGVDALVDEVDGDAEHLHAVVERLLDRADARERRQQRRVDVDHALREARPGTPALSSCM